MQTDVFSVRLASLVQLLAVLGLLVFFAAPASAKCEGEEFRQFDFWLGEWNVKDIKSGREGMVNSITSHHEGCALREDYVASERYSGMSINFFDKADGKWHQTWIDNGGGALYLEGGLDESGNMVLSSDSDPINRITWTPNEDGSVRQHWQVSKDGGKTWETAFDGLYTKR